MAVSSIATFLKIAKDGKIDEMLADDRCVFDNGSSDSASCYSLWEEVSATYPMCVIQSKTGTSVGLGMFFVFYCRTYARLFINSLLR